MKTAAFFRNSFLLLPMAALALAGCSKPQEEEIIPETTLEMNYPAIPFTIDSADVAGGQFEMDLDIDANVLGQVLAANQYSLAQLTQFKFTKANLFLTSPVTGNYNAMHAVTLQVAVDQSPPLTVAGMNPVPNGAQTLLLHMGDVNVLDLMKSSNVHFVFKVQLDGPLPAMSSHSLVLGAKVGVGL
jgi:hypothetical protein